MPSTMAGARCSLGLAMFVCAWCAVPVYSSDASGDAAPSNPAAEAAKDGLRIGWASVDISPDRPVFMAGYFNARVSEGVADPITATALAFESVAHGRTAGHVVMVSCDLISISDDVRDAVRTHLRGAVPELDPQAVFISATHTHVAPENRVKPCALRPLPLQDGNRYRGVDCEEVGVMSPAEYAAFAAERIADAVTRAWRERQPGAVGFGLGHAVVGRNRLITRFNNRSSMYGDTSHPEFSHVEGYEDHSVHALFTWNEDRELTGVVVNLACPSQAAGGYLVSADFWHEARIELRRRLGEHVFVLPQLSAAGDQSPSILVDKAAEARMRRLTGRTLREEIGVRIADAVTAVLPWAQTEMEWNPPLALRVETVELTRRPITEAELQQASADAERFRKSYERLRREFDENSEKKKARRWYTEISRAYANWARNRRVEVRHADLQVRPKLPIEVHVVRLGDVAFATNPFELYVDFGIQLKSRSKAVQTFLVQHTGCGTYVPTARSLALGGYGTSPQGVAIAPEGGRELVEETLKLIASLWADP